MKAAALSFEQPVCLVGGGALNREMLEQALRHAPALVAADGAADRLAEWGYRPRAVIGDMDSISDPDAWRDGETRFIHLPEQETTDFGKCLYATEAPFYVAVGFTGRRIDHMLAVFSAMLGAPEKIVVLVGEAEVAALVPPRGVELALEQGAIVSLYPLAPVTGVRSEGLEWPIDGLAMQAGHRIGTSNRATQSRVELAFDRPGALLMLERRFLDTLIGAVAN